MIRLFDIILSLALITLLLVPMGFIAAAIFMNSGCPILFHQVRVGQHGRRFTILKFRSMVVSQGIDGSGSVSGASWEEKKEARAAFQTTIENDARVTKVGRLLRRTHMDELPQLFNVLKGDMSLVGVRPDTPAQEVDYDPQFWQRRHAFRPGITGPAQTLGGSHSTPEERRARDLFWVENRSSALYFKTLLGTLRKVAQLSSY